MAALAVIIDRTPRISIITQIEVLRFNDTPENEKVLEDFTYSCVIYRLSDEVARYIIINICKHHKIKLPDAIITAAALIEGPTIVTRNVDDFKNIAGLSILNPRAIPA
jgi:predicted nucleic acid-binding protein